MSVARSAIAVVAAAVAALSAASAPAVAQKPQRDLVMRDELLQSQREKDLYMAIRALRPRFLEPPRGVRTIRNGVAAPTVVYVDRSPVGGIDALRTILAVDVHEVRYLDPARSENEYGPSASGGAIVVKMFKVIKPATPPKDTTASTGG